MTRSRISHDSKLLPLIAVLTFMVLAAWLAFTHDQYRSVGKLLADQHGASVEASYRASSRMYQLSAGIMFRELSRHPAVIDWLETANGGDEHERARIRDWFSKLLRSDYLRLRDEGFVQFQIHLADGSVLYRFHRPEAFGDALTEMRPSVRLAHTQRRTIVGFEAGRGYPALRHVFPVEYERQLLGSIELSVPFTRLQRRFEELLPGNTFLMVSERGNMFDGDDESTRWIPLASGSGNRLEISGDGLSLVTRDFTQSAAGRQILASLLDRDELTSLGTMESRLSIPILSEGRGFFASFVPVANVVGETVAHVLAIAPAPELVGTHTRFVLQGIVGGVVILFLGSALALLLVAAARRRQQEMHVGALNLQLSSLVETIPDLVCFKDMAGRWVVANEACLRFYELEGSDWEGKTNRELAVLRPEYEEELLAAAERDEEVLRDGILRVYDSVVIRDGGTRLFEVRKTPHLDRGQAVSLLVICRDVTEERQIKTRLVVSEQRYRAVVDNVKEVIFRTDAEGRWSFLNPAWEELTACRIEDALGASAIEFFHPDDRDRMLACARGMLTGQHSNMHEEVRIRRADGGIRWVELLLHPALDANDRPGESYGTLVDVTERRNVLDALRAERDLFAGGPVVAFVWRNEGGWPVEYVSSNVSGELGYSAEYLMAHDFEYGTLIHPDDLPRIEAEVHAHLVNRTPVFDLSYRIRHGSRGYRWIQEHSMPVWDEAVVDGTPLRIRGYVLDRTEAIEARLALEDERRRLAWTLEGANVGTMEWDLQKGELTVNERWAEMLGYTLDELGILSTSAWTSLVHPDDRARCWELTRSSLKDDDSYYESEHRMRHKSGSWIWVLVRGRILSRTPDGEPLVMCGTHMDITRRRTAEAHAEHLAYYDELTGLPNRRLLLERLRHAQAASTRNHLFGALFFLDLDNFKNLNDSLGHDYGDLLLQEVAQRLRGIVRSGDTVARLGGDEFVILLEELDVDEGQTVGKAERAVHKVLEILSEPYELKEHRYHLTPSIGVTLFRSGEQSPEALMKKADLSMYQAKAAGKGTFRFFDQAMQAVAERRAQLEAELRLGLEAEQFVLAYQPIVDRHGEITSVEALVRWRHPTRGMLSPAEFIPVAEASGLIGRIGNSVLRAACRQLAAWKHVPGRSDWRIAVNVSAYQLHQEDFVEQVVDALRGAGADGERLRLEITESMLLDNLAETITKMSALRSKGLSFALDDFGTGYSSLNYLKKLPLSVLKIDKSFVRDLAVDASDAAIVQTIIAMAHSLDLRVVAEGVETAEQRDFLLAHGCESLQGFFFYHPMTIDLLDETLGG